MLLGAVLPCGQDGAASLSTDAEVRLLVAALWQDIVKWGAENGGERCLTLFQVDRQNAQTFGWNGSGHTAPRGLAPDTPPCEWAFVPASDLLLVCGEGLIGVSAEGTFADNVPHHQRFGLAELCAKIPDQIPESLLRMVQAKFAPWAPPAPPGSVPVVPMIDVIDL